MTEAVIFDLDGVTVDSRGAWTESFKQAAQKFGFEYSEELDHLTRGVGVIKSAENLTAHYKIPEKETQFLNATKTAFNNLFAQKVTLMPGLLELLGRLDKKYNLALASSSPRFVLSENFTKFPQLTAYFEVSIAGDEVERTKPSPDIFLLAARRLEVDPEKCLVIEDSPTGVVAAKAAGMKCIGLLDAGPKKQDISKADKQVERLDEIDAEMISNL
ncbi:MAG: HAD family phosphatase [Candidatus Woykebacteria bacterium]